MLKFSVPNCNIQLRHIFYVHNCSHEQNVLWVTVTTHQALFNLQLNMRRDRQELNV